MKPCMCLFLFLLLATSSSAQAVTSYAFKVYNQGASAPLSTTAIAASGFTCGQPKTTAPPGTMNNPTRIAFTDPADGTKDCIYTDAGTGPLLSLPFGAQVYVSTLASVNSAGTGSDSSPSNPFAHVGQVPPPVTSLRVVP